MLATLFIVRLIATMIWFIVAIFCIGSIVRTWTRLFGAVRQYDRVSGILFWIALIFICYSVRAGVYPRTFDAGGDLSSALGLQVLSVFVAVGSMRERLDWSGWKL